MWVRMSIDGELLENLIQDANVNRRSKQQQILYYLQEIYKGNIIIQEGNRNVPQRNTSVVDYPTSVVQRNKDVHKWNEPIELNDSMLDF